MSVFCEPWNRPYVTNAPRQGRRELRQPLPGCVSLFLFYPGVPRLSPSRPAGAEFGATETVPSRSEAKCEFDRIVNFVRTKKTLAKARLKSEPQTSYGVW